MGNISAKSFTTDYNMPFQFSKVSMDGLVIVEPRVFPDERGVFLETYKKSEFSANGILVDFIQDNHSLSIRGVLRASSPTYKKWYGVELSGENKKMLFIPAGFAHGFVTLSDSAHLLYKCSSEYAPQHDGGIFWNDPEIGIPWPEEKPLVSPKDEVLPLLSQAGQIFL
jgi:dTDP-4-dehydrorhamnose 3,5-epimerase